MGFKIGKLLGYLTFPSSLIFVGLVLGVVALVLAGSRPRLRRLGLGLVVVATILFGVTGRPEAWRGIASGLETRFPRLAENAPAPAGIIFIGGVVDGVTELQTGQPKYGMGSEAIDETLRLAQRWPDVPIVLSGTGTIASDGLDLSEAGTMARILVARGIPSDRLILERRSRTTWENATFSHRMVQPAPGARWLLVTPAWHMPRSIGAFRAAGWTGVVAAPSLGETLRPDDVNTSMAARMHLFDVMAREWTGLVAYRLLGRSSALFPAP
ncbi:MAG: YdcF family protein [Hyphomicrobiales bacterium]|nr:YdcF family protein [Hyphomicrobiales bacterium]